MSTLQFVCLTKRTTQTETWTSSDLPQWRPYGAGAIGILGPLPETEQGNRYLLVAMDYFTKWPEMYPLPNQEAITLAPALIGGIFCRFGLPLEIHSDQGNFESKVFAENVPTYAHLQDKDNARISPVGWHGRAIQPHVVELPSHVPLKPPARLRRMPALRSVRIPIGGERVYRSATYQDDAWT